MIKFKNRETGIVLEPPTDQVAELLRHDVRYILVIDEPVKKETKPKSSKG